MAEMKPTLNDRTLALDDVKNKEDEGVSIDGLVNYINERYTRSEESRRKDETRWLRAYRNYRGLYGPDVQFTETEKSRVFIKYAYILFSLFKSLTIPGCRGCYKYIGHYATFFISVVSLK